jgi:glyoxylase-like metal-dependent hydrolase (beta-lactamase superfamily II)
VKIHPLECGWLTIDFGAIVSGQSGKIRVPVGAYLLEHARGLVLFDMGMHPSLVDSSERIGAVAKMIEVDMPAEAQLTAQLAAVGQDPGDVVLAVASHLHFDHVGGLAELPNATLIVQAAEWAAAGQGGRVAGSYNREDFDLGHERRLVEGVVDVFGDGSLVIHPTPGHTVGHQSLVVEGRTLFVGDACFCRVALDNDALPEHTGDPERHRQTFTWLRRREAEGMSVVFSHDPDQWARVRTGAIPLSTG